MSHAARQPEMQNMEYDTPKAETPAALDSMRLLSIRPETLQAAAKACHDKLPDHCGFLILVAPFGDPTDGDTQGQYISNMNREDAIKILKTMLFRFGVNDQWMKDA